MLNEIIKVHESILGRELTEYEIGLIRSAFFSGYALGLQKSKEEI